MQEFLFPDLPLYKKRCTKIFAIGEPMFHCHQCNRGISIYCNNCFQQSNHIGHRIKVSKSEGGCCDCGDFQSMQQSNICGQHKQKFQGIKLQEQVIERFVQGWRCKLRQCGKDRSMLRPLIQKLIRHSQLSCLYSDLVYLLLTQYAQSQSPLVQWFFLSQDSDFAQSVVKLCINLFQNRNFKKLCCLLFVKHFQQFPASKFRKLCQLASQMFIGQQAMANVLNNSEHRIRCRTSSLKANQIQDLFYFISCIFQICQFDTSCKTFFKKSYQSFQDIYKIKIQENEGNFIIIQKVFFNTFLGFIPKLENDQHLFHQLLTRHAILFQQHLNNYSSISHQNILFQIFIQFRVFFVIAIRIARQRQDISALCNDFAKRIPFIVQFRAQVMLMQAMGLSHPSISDIIQNYSDSNISKIDHAALQLYPVPYLLIQKNKFSPQNQFRFCIRLGIELIGLQVDKSNSTYIRLSMGIQTQQDSQYWDLFFSNLLSMRKQYKRQELNELIYSLDSSTNLFQQEISVLRDLFWQVFFRIGYIQPKNNHLKLRQILPNPDPFHFSANYNFFIKVENLLDHQKYYWQQMRVAKTNRYLVPQYLQMVSQRLQFLQQSKAIQKGQFQKMALIIIKMSKVSQNQQFSQRAINLAKKILQACGQDFESKRKLNQSRQQQNSNQTVRKELCLDNQIKSQKIRQFKQKQKNRLKQAYKTFEVEVNNSQQVQQKLCNICREVLDLQNPQAEPCFITFSNLPSFILQHQQPSQRYKKKENRWETIDFNFCRHSAHMQCLHVNQGKGCSVCRGYFDLFIPCREWLNSGIEDQLKNFFMDQICQKLQHIYFVKTGKLFKDLAMLETSLSESRNRWLLVFAKSLSSFAALLAKNSTTLSQHKIEEINTVIDFVRYLFRQLARQKQLFGQVVFILKQENCYLREIAALAAQQIVFPKSQQSFQIECQKYLKQNQKQALMYLFFNRQGRRVLQTGVLSQNRLLIKLPFNLIEFFDKFIKRSCSKCLNYFSIKSQEVFICLICGESLCILTCPSLHFQFGSLNFHTRAVHGGQAVFIGRDTVKVAVISVPFNTLLDSVYCDRFGNPYQKNDRRQKDFKLNYGVICSLEKSLIQNKLIALIKNQQTKKNFCINDGLI